MPWRSWITLTGRCWPVWLLWGAIVGCAAKLPYQIDDEFRKKVAKDPFPSAAQQGIYSTTIK